MTKIIRTTVLAFVETRNWLLKLIAKGAPPCGEERHLFCGTAYLAAVSLLLALFIATVGVKGYSLAKSRAVSNENNVIVLDRPVSGKASLVIKWDKNNGYTTGMASNFSILRSGLFERLGSGSILADGDLLKSGDAVYRFSLHESVPDRSLVYKNSLARFRKLHISGMSRIKASVNDGDSVLFNAGDSDRGEFAVISTLSVQRRLLSVRASSEEGVRLTKGTFGVMLKPSGYASDGDMIECGGNRFRVQITDSIFGDEDSDVLHSEPCFSLYREEAGKTDSVGAALIETGYYSKSKDGPLPLGDRGKAEVNSVPDGWKITFSELTEDAIINRVEIIGNGGVKTLGNDVRELLVAVGDRSYRVIHTDDGAAVLNVDDADEKKYYLSDNRPNLLITRDRLVGVFSGSVMPDSVTDRSSGKDVADAVRRSFRSDRGFINGDVLDKAVRQVNIKKFADHYNKMRCPVGVMLTGDVYYTRADGTTGKVDLNKDVSWSCGESKPTGWPNPGPSWDGKRDTIVGWDWGPPLAIHWNTEYTGEKWLWYPEPWHPEDHAPGEQVERYFVGKINLPGVLKSCRARLFAACDTEVYLNGIQVTSRVVSPDGVTVGSWADRKELDLRLYSSSDNTIAVRAVKAMPTVGQVKMSDVFGKFGPSKVASGRYPRIQGVGAMTERSKHISASNGRRGTIWDTDKFSNPLLVVEKGDAVLKKGTVFMLDYKSGSLPTSQKTYLFFRNGGCGIPATGGVYCADVYNINIAAPDDESSVSESFGTPVAGSYTDALTFVVTGTAGARRHVSYTGLKTDAGGHGKELSDGDTVRCADVVFRFRDDGGALASDLDAGSGLEKRKYQESAALQPIVGMLSAPVRTGAETVFDRILRGGAGKSSDVILTIDDDLQRMAYMELSRVAEECRRQKPGNYESAMVLMDADTGELLAAVTLPVADYDINKLQDAGYYESAHGARSSLIERCWKQPQFHPGSTFKLVTATAALAAAREGGYYSQTINTMLSCDHSGPGSIGYRPRQVAVKDMSDMEMPGLDSGSLPQHLKIKGIRNCREDVHPDTGFNLEDAIALSPNTYFGYMALLMHKPYRSRKLGQTFADSDSWKQQFPLAYYAMRYGYNKTSDLVPSFEDATLTGILNRSAGDVFYSDNGSFPLFLINVGDVARCGFGQSEVYSTPLLQAVVAATVANDGFIPSPVLVNKAAGFKMVSTIKPKIIEESDKALQDDMKRIRDGMRLAVYSGTVHASHRFESSAAAGIKPYVYAKTGTAQHGYSDDDFDSWFTGFVEKPVGNNKTRKLAFCCVVGDGGYGGATAGKAVENFLLDVFRYYGW